MDPPRVQHEEVQALSAEQARHLLTVAANDRLGAVFILALATGMRQGEVLGLKWENVDLEKGKLHVKTALQRVEGKFVLADPKTAKSQRMLPLPKVALAALKQHRALQAEERLRVGAAWQEKWGLVFTTSNGTPLDARNVLRSFTRLLKVNGLPEVRFHDLRHSCASLLLSQGVSLRMIMEILGHSQIGLTANLYTHIAPIMHEEAAAQMDAVLAAR
ncbi:MAG: site-specific integrase [Dehalococcoidia bacterium]|nr:site-specific integrase [Dehalococcoidia bacterium]